MYPLVPVKEATDILFDILSIYLNLTKQNESQPCRKKITDRSLFVQMLFSVGRNNLTSQEFLYQSVSR